MTAPAPRPKTRPSILGIGKVTEIGDVTRIHGWAFGSCAERCPCHISSIDHQPHIFQDEVNGRVGLISYRDDVCPCCDTWTAAELIEVIRDVNRMNNWLTEENA